MSTPASKRTTLSRAYRDGLAEEMARDDSIVVLGTDLYERGGHWAQVTNLGPQFGRDRVRNAPISEAAMVAAGVGAAMNGLRPVVDLNFLDFAFGAMDEIVNQAAKIRYWWGRRVNPSLAAYLICPSRNALKARRRLSRYLCSRAPISFACMT